MWKSTLLFIENLRNITHRKYTNSHVKDLCMKKPSVSNEELQSAWSSLVYLLDLMFIVHGCCPSCDLFGIHYSFSIYSILSILLFLISISKFSVNNSYLIHIPFQMGTNRAICECPCGLHISDRWNFTTKRARSNLHTFASRKGKGFSDLLPMTSVNHSCQHDMCQIIFKITRLSPSELFWAYQKNYFCFGNLK